MTQPKPIIRHSIRGKSRRVSLLLWLADVGDLWLRTYRSLRRDVARQVRPTFDDLRNMGPERLAQWHRETGIEARVVAALAEAVGRGETQSTDGIQAVGGGLEPKRAPAPAGCGTGDR